MQGDDLRKMTRRAFRQILQEIQLVHMVAAADLRFRISLLASLVSTAIAIVGAATPGHVTLFSFNAPSVLGAAGAIISLILMAWDFKQYELGTSVKRAKTRTVNGFTRLGAFVSFADVSPSSEESSFVASRNPHFSNDAYFRSEQFDNNLAGQKSVPFTRTRSRRFRFFAREESARVLQLKYLIPRVRNSRVIPTTNDKKCGLSARLGPTYISSVQLYKTGYFDSLITNEAFRSEIYFENNLIEEELPSGRIDLTQHYPAYRDAADIGKGRAHLAALDATPAANHIGITTIVVTRDNRVLLFRQGNTAIDRGSIVSGGSGSVDWSDISLAERKGDLISLIKVAMAREFCEEASARTAYRVECGLYRRKARVLHAAKGTIVTGFFRWVDRCGKPEFIGASRTPLLYSQLLPDDFEVTEFEFDGIAVHRMEDFNGLLDQIGHHLECHRHLKMGLSTYVALRRLGEIATYRNSSNPAERNIFEVVQTALALA